MKRGLWSDDRNIRSLCDSGVTHFDAWQVDACHLIVTKHSYALVPKTSNLQESGLNPNDDDLVERIRRDLADSYDEEFELEL
ncbi:MAG: hypothetical protein WCK94_13690, partial [Comamonadaceae bacterium]